jgi:hypothetical protein
MWRTPLGERVLTGVEKSFYVESTLYAIDRLTELNEFDGLDLLPLTGDRIFDSSTFAQKVILIRDALAALIDPSVEIPKHTNVNEAAAYFMFAILREAVEDEIKEGAWVDDISYYWRELIWSAFEEYCRADWEDDDDDSESLELTPHSDKFELFRTIIEDMEERIFWDLDWQHSYHEPQLLDGVEPTIEAVMGYGDYFTTRLPKTTESEVEAAIKYMKSQKQ